MTGLRTEEPLDKIAHDQPATRSSDADSHSLHHIPDSDYAIAEQLVQHSQRARHDGNLELLPDSNRDIGEVNQVEQSEHQRMRLTENGQNTHHVDPYYHPQVSPRSVSQESGLRPQPESLNPSPTTSGQICRFVVPDALLSKRGAQSTERIANAVPIATAGHQKRLFGEGHQPGLPFAISAGCISKQRTFHVL